MLTQSMRRGIVFFLVLAVGLAMSFALSVGDVNAAAKAKKITLKASAKTVMVGNSVKITVKKVTPKKASKKVTWTVKKGKDAVKLAKKKATSVEVKAIKEGAVTIQAKAKKGKAKATIKIMVIPKETKQLKKFGITGYYQDGIDTINTVPLDKELTVGVWDKATDAFVDGTTADINGNYTALYDTDGNDKADQVEVVKFADGPDKWDATAAWIPGAGENKVPIAMTDEEGQAMFGAEFRLPMGQRMLEEFGIGDWSGVTDFANLENGGYWENNYADFYHQGSTDTLTMLTGYKTEMQPSGSLCVMSSASTVLEWYGQRGDLNQCDLALLRGNDCTERRGTSLNQTIQMFTKLGELGLTCEWEWESYNDFEGAEMDSEWVQEQLAKGHPIIVISNSWGAHGQVIIGYDNMGTVDTLDDVCIMMDPYDSTDQNNDGYIIQPFERLQYSVLTWPDEEYFTGCKYIAAWPKDPALWDNTYKATKGTALKKTTTETPNFTDEMKLDYGISAKDIVSFYPQTETDEILDSRGLGGAAAGGYTDDGEGRVSERVGGDHNNSPYFSMIDFYNKTNEAKAGTGTLHILPQFKTIQQVTEWACGPTSALMNIEWFGKNEKRTAEDDPGKGEYETALSLATHRVATEYPGTFLTGMEDIFKYMSSQYNQDWKVFTINDMTYDENDEANYIGDYALEGGDDPSWPGLIPYLIDNGIPMMIGSDEWGGHWQVLIGYDSMGTPASQDDVIILADPYDTTDHNQDGYVIKSFERLVYAWNASFEQYSGGPDYDNFIVAFPAEGHENVVKDLGLK